MASSAPLRFALVVDGDGLGELLRRLERERRRNGRVRLLKALVIVEGDPRVVGALSRGVARVQRIEPLQLQVSIVVLGRG